MKKQGIQTLRLTQMWNHQTSVDTNFLNHPNKNAETRKFQNQAAPFADVEICHSIDVVHPTQLPQPVLLKSLPW